MTWQTFKARAGQWKAAIIGTLLAWPIWKAAVLSIQLLTVQPPIPLWQSGINQWTLTNAYQTSVMVSGVTYTVAFREGYSCDLASIDKALQKPLGLTHDSPCIARAGLIHDGATGLIDADGNGPISPHMANLIFYQACLDDGTEPAKALAAYKAVELWLWFVLSKHNSNTVAEAKKFVSISMN